MSTGSERGSPTQRGRAEPVDRSSHTNRPSPPDSMSGMDPPLDELNGTGVSLDDGGTFLRFSPTSVAAAGAGGHRESVYVYVWLFLGLLVFLLTLLVVALHRLKNIITSSSSLPEGGSSSGGGSSFTNMEICSLSSQRSTISSLST